MSNKISLKDSGDKIINPLISLTPHFDKKPQDWDSERENIFLQIMKKEMFLIPPIVYKGLFYGTDILSEEELNGSDTATKRIGDNAQLYQESMLAHTSVFQHSFIYDNTGSPKRRPVNLVTYDLYLLFERGTDKFATEIFFENIKDYYLRGKYGATGKTNGNPLKKITYKISNKSDLFTYDEKCIALELLGIARWCDLYASKLNQTQFMVPSQKDTINFGYFVKRLLDDPDLPTFGGKAPDNEDFRRFIQLQYEKFEGYGQSGVFDEIKYIPPLEEAFTFFMQQSLKNERKKHDATYNKRRLENLDKI